MSETLLAFDLGTTGNKAALVDAATGRVLDSETVPYPTRYTEDGGAEQSPDAWWQSAVSACRALTARRPAEMAQVAAIGCGGMMNGVVLVDAAGQALRDAIIHADVRSAPQCRRLEHEIGRAALRAATANRPDPHLTLPKIRWLRDHEPEILRRAAWVVQAKDFLAGRLTGVWGLTDPSDASLTGAFDVASRRWADDVWTGAGLEARLLPHVVPSSQIIGGVTPEAARATGLLSGTPIVMGGGDAACATAGAGVALGEGYNYLGGTSWIGLSAAAPLDDERLSNYCNLDASVTVYGTTQAAGSSVEWLGGLFGEQHAALDAQAAVVPPGARDLFFLPYLQGERAPLWDSDARGVFFGLASHHGRADLYRAVLEGVTFALSSILDVFAENGHPLPTMRLLGGGAKSALWRTVLGGVYGRQLWTVVDVSAATSLGAAMAAGVGIGLYPNWAATRRLVTVAREDAPDPALVAAYAPRTAFFHTLYPALQHCFAALAHLHGVSAGGGELPDFPNRLPE